MFKELGADPGKLVRTERMRRSVFGGSGEEGENDPKTEAGLDRFLPGYLREGPAGPAAGWMSKMLGGEGEGGTLFSSPEMPYNSALETAAPAVELAAQLPGLDAMLPDRMKNDEGMAGILSRIANLPGGGPNELLRFVVEEGTGVDMFTGAPTENQSTNDRIYRFIDSFAPVASKGRRTMKDMMGEGAVEGQGYWTTARRARLFQNIVGFDTRNVDDDASFGAMYESLKQLEKDIDSYRESVGEENWATFDDLRSAGIIPDIDAYRDPEREEAFNRGELPEQRLAPLRPVTEGRRSLISGR